MPNLRGLLSISDNSNKIYYTKIHTAIRSDIAQLDHEESAGISRVLQAISARFDEMRGINGSSAPQLLML